jgi:hypothetical protein
MVKISTLNAPFYLLRRISKLSIIFHREREVFKETEDVGKYVDTMLFLFLSISDFFYKKGELGEYFEVCSIFILRIQMSLLQNRWQIVSFI